MSNFALNSKRSTCETAGKKCVVDEMWPKFKKKGEKCSQLRSCASSGRRKPSVRWRLSFGSLVSSWSPCVELDSGESWRSINWFRKQHWLVPVKRLSRKAMRRLLYWCTKTTLVNGKKWGNIEDNKDEQYEEDEDKDEQKEEEDESVQSGPQRKKTRTKALRGKYTCHNNGTTKHGGWSDKGMARFNELYELVKKDRRCPRAVVMEK